MCECVYEYQAELRDANDNNNDHTEVDRTATTRTNQRRCRNFEEKPSRPFLPLEHSLR